MSNPPKKSPRRPSRGSVGVALQLLGVVAAVRGGAALFGLDVMLLALGVLALVLGTLVEAGRA